MTLAHAPASSVAAPSLARAEPVLAALCLAQCSEPLFAAIAQSQGATEPPGYARLFFIPVYAFLAWVLWRDRKAALGAARAVPAPTAFRKPRRTLSTGNRALTMAASMKSRDSSSGLWAAAACSPGACGQNR